MKIATKFIFMMCILGFLIVGSLFWTTQYVIIPWHIETLEQKAREVAYYIKATSPYITEAESQRHISIIQKEQKDLSYLLVVDRNGKALVHSDPHRVGMVFDDEGTLKAAREEKEVKQIYTRDQNNPNSQYHGERIIDILIPYYDKNGQHVGAVNVGLSLNKIDQVKARYYKIISVNAILVLLFLIFLTYRHFKYVITPLSTIAEMARRFGEGKPDHVFKIERTDEIGILALEFNNVSKKITSEIAERKKSQQELQASYEELTAANEELMASNEELVAVEEELKATNDELFNSYSRLNSLLESITDGFCALDQNYAISYMNSEAERLLSKTKDQVLGNVWESEFPEFEATTLKRVIEEQISVEFNSYNYKLGSWLEFRAYPSPEGLSIYFHDITERKQSEEQLVINNKYLSSLYETTLDLIDRLDVNDLLQTILKRAGSLMGTKHGWLCMVSEKNSEIIVQLGMGLYQDYIGLSLKPGEGLTGKVWQSGEPIYVEDYSKWSGRTTKFKSIIYGDLAFPLKSRGKVVGVIGISYQQKDQKVGNQEFKLLNSFSQLASIALENARLYNAVQEELVERIKAEEIVRYQAHHDYLTNLPNRLLFNDRLALSLANSKRNEKFVGLLFLDLDSFKLVNDTMGHDVGDQLLKGIAKRLSGIIRESDTMARIGGDEFTILLQDLSFPEDAGKVAEKVISSFNEPFLLDDREFFITTSIGITIYPIDGEDVKTLLKNADIAMYKAKSQGRNNYRFFTPTMNEKNMHRLDLENSLRRGLEKNEFEIYYQPQVEVSSGKIIGHEALLRWNHPQKGLLSPTEFISVAEETGLIVPIGEQVLKRACNQNKDWQMAGFPPMRVAVNLSARQFLQQNLVHKIAQILDEYGMDPCYLELEITESLAMQDLDFTIKTIQELRRMGISIAVDDFGTGYSSLSYLKRLPIDIIKIDRSFIRDINIDPKNEAIIQTIILLAHNLNLKVIAEGVETIGQREYLQDKKCDEMQGYLLYKPMSASQATEILIETFSSNI